MHVFTDVRFFVFSYIVLDYCVFVLVGTSAKDCLKRHVSETQCVEQDVRPTHSVLECLPSLD